MKMKRKLTNDTAVHIAPAQNSKNLNFFRLSINSLVTGSDWNVIALNNRLELNLPPNWLGIEAVIKLQHKLLKTTQNIVIR